MSLVRITVEDLFDGLFETVLAVDDLTDGHSRSLITALENAVNEWRAAHPDYHEDFDPSIYYEEDEEDETPNDTNWIYGNAECDFCNAKAAFAHHQPGNQNDPTKAALFCSRCHSQHFVRGHANKVCCKSKHTTGESHA